jgi:hypothetical protein
MVTVKKLAILLIAFPFPLLAQIGNKIQQNKISGIWQNTQFGYQMTLMLNEDGDGEFDGEEIKYTYQGNKLSISENGGITVYNCVLQGNTLSLSGGDLDGTITFNRSGTDQTPAISNQTVTTPLANTRSNSDGVLIGTWSGNGETLEFKSNGQCVYLGNTYPYQLSPGSVTLITSQGNATFSYKINGNQLTLSANGKEVSYLRGSGNSSNQGANNNVSDGKNIPQELVGKWCWMNVTSTNSGGTSSSRCIVLNANGTYQYSSERSMDVNTNDMYGGTASQDSDQGTWWVQGDRVFYNSPTRGQGSYGLQKVNHPKTGDPMIVLDGESYVTYYQRQPWR